MRLKIQPVLALTALTALALMGQTPGEPAKEPFSPFQSRQEAEEFLRTAKVIKIAPLGSGVTNSKKVTLDNGTIQHYAVFKDIDDRRKGIIEFEGFPEIDFKDSWKFEVAAYELDKLLGMNLVPVTVARSVDRKLGSLELWMDGCKTETYRQKEHLHPPNVIEWNHQMYKAFLFDCLLFNIDSNKGNLLYTPAWRMFKIDHTRTFKNVVELRRPQNLKYFSRSMIDGLQKLDLEKLKACCKDYLSSTEMKCLLGRRDLILKLYAEVLAEKGEEVLYD